MLQYPKPETHSSHRASPTDLPSGCPRAGHTTSRVPNAYEAEYKLLCEMPRHRNIIALLHHFVAAPPPPFFQAMPADTQAIAVHPNYRTGGVIPLKTQFVLMECHAMTLKEHLIARGARVSAADVKRFCCDVAAALLFLQQHRVVHRDLKLDNLLYSPRDGRTILCDFGVAVRVDRRGRAVVGNGAPGGNSAHLAPEVLASHSRQEKARVGMIQLDYSHQARGRVLLLRRPLGWSLCPTATHTRTHTDTHAHPPTHTCTHIHTYTHTHT